MALIIEDGSIVAGANSYASVAELDAYAAERGISLPADNAEKEVLLVKAKDYIEAKTNWQGLLVDPAQPLSWPRYGVTLNGYPFQYNAIPSVLKEAQLDIAANSVGVDLLPVQKPNTKGQVVEETVGPLSVKYAQPQNPGSVLPTFPRADALLSQLFVRRGIFTYRA